jgi:tripartite-type tricarboxylate transporter receptor subunit TctC
VGTALKDPEVTVAFSALGLEPAGEGPEALAMTIRANVAQWQDVVERAGFNQN